MPLSEPLAITLRLAKELERLGIPYFVGGSLASSLYGIPRATQDADLVADLRPEHVDLLVKALDGDFYVDGDMIREALRARASFNVIHLATMFKADVFILKADDSSRQEMAGRERFILDDNPEQALYLARPEDIIVHKMLWYKKGGEVSERQWRDAAGILQVLAGRLDMDYMERSAQARGVADLLARVRGSAGGIILRVL